MASTCAGVFMRVILGVLKRPLSPTSTNVCMGGSDQNEKAYSRHLKRPAPDFHPEHRVEPVPLGRLERFTGRWVVIRWPHLSVAIKIPPRSI